MTSRAIETAGAPWPADLLFLLDLHPRDGWANNPALGELAHFWLHKHASLNSLAARVGEAGAALFQGAAGMALAILFLSSGDEPQAAEALLHGADGVAFPAGAVGGANYSPAWSADGAKVAFSSSRSGDPEIWVVDAAGGNAHKVTSFVGPDLAPTWNPRSNAQIAWVSGRTGLPQVYTMDADGANIQRMTDGGYAISPSWSPNGQFLTFSWNRKYGPGAPGGQDIYIMDIASKRWLQLTHEAGSNDFPSWAPDNRHIVFERAIGGHTEIWSMLADGTEQHQLTHTGNNFMPNWSWK